MRIPNDTNNADNRLKAYKQIGGDTEKLEKSFFAVRLFHAENVQMIRSVTGKLLAQLTVKLDKNCASIFVLYLAPEPISDDKKLKQRRF